MSTSLITRGGAAVGTSLIAALLLAAPAMARDIGPGEPLAPASTSCRNVIPEDRSACTGERDPYSPGTSRLVVDEEGFGPASIGFAVLGGIAVTGLIVTTVTTRRHHHTPHPA